MRKLCRECYSDPRELYDALMRHNMDLVTVTDHDSIDAAESLRHFPNFFLSEEVTCVTPAGTQLHVGVYDINERQHIELQNRRRDLHAFIAYLNEENLFSSVNHAFSCLTGKRLLEDFEWIAAGFPALEVLNAQIPALNNRQAETFARLLQKTALAGSDGHTIASAGLAYTEVPGARTREQFFDGLRSQRSIARGSSGNWRRLARDVLAIAGGMMREHAATVVLAPLAPLVPLATATQHLLELRTADLWARRLCGASFLAAREALASEPLEVLS